MAVNLKLHPLGYADLFEGFAGEDFNFPGLLENTGDDDLPAGNITVSWYVSKDDVLDVTEDISVGSVDYAAGLEPGESMTQHSRLSAYDSLKLEPGDYTFFAVVDPKDAVNEGDETDNIQAIAFSILPEFDLVALNLALTGTPRSFYFGDGTETIGLEASVTNAGPDAALPSRGGWYLSEDTNVTRDDTLLVSFRNIVPGLLPGQTQSFFHDSIPLPALDEGTYYVSWIADDLDELRETNATGDAEANNAATPIQIEVNRDLNLFARDGFLSQSTVDLDGGGASVRAHYTIDENGYISATGLQGIRALYLSEDEFLDDTDTPLFAGVGPMPALPASYETTVTLHNQQVREGDYHILFRAWLNAASGAGPEVDTSDNVLDLGTLTLTASPDVTILDGPVLPGAQFSAQEAVNLDGITYINQGRGAATDYDIGVYARQGSGAATTADVFLGSLDAIDLEGLSDPVTQNNLPVSFGGLTPGDWSLWALIDDANDLDETNEINNVFSLGSVEIIQHLPDLNGGDINLTGDSAFQIVAGQAITFDQFIRNSGPGSAGGYDVEFRLSTNDIITTSDTYLGTSHVTTGGGGRSVRSESFTTDPLAMDLAPGIYWLGTRLDTSGDVQELNENNNTSVPLQIEVLARQPNLVMGDVSMTVNQNVFEGASRNTFDGVFRVENVGSLSAPETQISYYISSDDTLSQDDMKIGDERTPAIAAGGFHEFSFTDAPLPPDAPEIAPGVPFWVFAVADEDEEANETDETDNVGGAQVVVPGAPDFEISFLEISSNHLAPGERVSVQFSVTNVGTGASLPDEVGIYLSSNTILTSIDTELVTFSLGALEVGESQGFVFHNLNLPNDAPQGLQYIGVIADSDFSVSELDENNNYSDATDAGLETISVVAPAPAEGGQVIAETGHLLLSNIPLNVVFEQEFENPVVFAKLTTAHEDEAVTVRLLRVHAGGFAMQLDEPTGYDDLHAFEKVTWMVVEAGDWVLPDGTHLSAGTVEAERLANAGAVNEGFERVSFTSGQFRKAPAVQTQIQTSNGGDWVIARQTDADGSGFTVGMQEDETTNGTHTTERIGWMAIDPGVGSWDGTSFAAGSSGNRVTQNHAQVVFDPATGFGPAAPGLLTSIATFDGVHPASARVRDLDGAGFDVKSEEEQALDAEVSHASEDIDYFAFGGPAGTLSGHARTLTPLVLGQPETGRFGNRYDGQSAPDGEASFTFKGGIADVAFTLQGYDVDFADEVEVFLNGVSQGFLALTPNNGPGPSAFVFDLADQVAGPNLVTVKQNLDDNYIWGVTDLAVDFAADAALTLGQPENGRFGNRYDGQSAPDGEVAFTFQGGIADLAFVLEGYDIDYDDEVELFLNGVSQGFLETTPDNGTGPSSFVFDLADQRPGQNLVSLKQTLNDAFTWGATELSIDYIADTALGVGQTETGRFGNRYDGQSAPDGEVSFTFEGDPRDLLFIVQSFDIDYADEVELFLNGVSQGFLETTPNNGTAPSSFTFAAEDQVAGQNLVTIAQNLDDGFTWGVTGLGLHPPADAVLTVGVTESGQFGHRYAGQSASDGDVTFVFEGGADALQFDLQGFDIDYADEVEVFLNGVPLGFLDVTPNNGTGPSSFAIAAADQLDGQNLITVEQHLDDTFVWGVTDLLIA